MGFLNTIVIWLSGIASLAGFLLFPPVFLFALAHRHGKVPRWIVVLPLCLAFSAHNALELNLRDAVKSDDLLFLKVSRYLSPGTWLLRRNALWNHALSPYSVSRPAVEFLLENGASPDEALREFIAELPPSRQKGNDLLLLILSYRPDPDVQYAGRSALIHLIEHDRFDLALQLLRAGAHPIPEKDSYQLTSLHQAAARRANSLFLSELAQRLGTDSWEAIDCNGRKPVHNFSNPEQLSLFADTPDKLMVPTRDGATLLHLSIQAGNLVVYDRLLELGIASSIADASGCPPLAYARTFQSYRRLRPQPIPDTPLTPATLERLWPNALQSGSDELISALLLEGCNPNSLLSNGNRPLHEIIQYSMSDKLIPLLASVGADINLDNRQRETPLIHAIRSSNASAAMQLLDLGADAQRRNPDKQLPLHLAKEALARVKQTPRNLSLNGLREELEACRPWEVLIDRLQKASVMAEVELPGDLPAGTGNQSGSRVSGSSTGEKTSRERTDRLCPNCSGTGNCQKCFGSGKATSYATLKKGQCSSCRGSPRCGTCGGKGRVNR